MKTLKFFFTPVFILIFSFCFGQHNIIDKSGKFFKNTIIFKVKPEYRSVCNTDKIKDAKWAEFFSSIKVSSFKQKFPKAELPKARYNERHEPLVDLSLIYEIEYTSSAKVEKVVSYLKSLSYIEYAQPFYVEHLLYTPNDSLLSDTAFGQWPLYKIHALEAWDICKGDTNVVIGISDTGNDNDHPDLKDNLHYNYNDPINGIDDDNDGYVDNFRGWDLGENDNDPQVETNPEISWDIRDHGIFVAGIADASTDNGKGVASPGFKCRYLPVKILNSNGDINAGYESIVYLADHGATVINCSWGSNFGTRYGQDIINYATYNKNVLVVASAGNDRNECLFYPASYENVISVAGTQQNDILSGSNWGIDIDLCGPATNMVTTYNDSYGPVYSGTSFSAPIVSACAAMVKSYFPTYNALQLGERLKVTADNIDTVAANAPYQELLGAGRVNMYRALHDTAMPSVRFRNYFITDNNNGVFMPGDTVVIKGTFLNYLAPTSALNVYITSASPYVEFMTGSNFFNIGTLGTYDTIVNYATPFKVKIMQDIPFDEKIDLKLTYIDNSLQYRAIQYIRIIGNPTFLNIDTNNVATTLTGNGKFGYSNFCPMCGIGFTFKQSESILYEGGLMVGLNDTMVSNCVRDDNDFNILQGATRILPNVYSDFDVSAKFNDDSAYLHKINILTEQNTLAWNDPDDANYILVRYNIINKNNVPLTNLYCGIYMDWDIYDASHNRCEYDDVNKLAYTYSALTSGLYSGIQLLSNTPALSYAFDNTGGIDLSDGFSVAEKYTALTTTRYSAGMTGTGSDVSNLLSSGPFSVGASDTIKIAFALLAGENLQELQTTAISAKHKYDSVFVSVPGITASPKLEFSVYPNPAKDKVMLEIDLEKSDHITVNLYNAVGVKTKELLKNDLTGGRHTYEINTSGLDNGCYFIELKSQSATLFTRKIMIIR